VPRHIQLAIRNDEELSKLLGKGASGFRSWFDLRRRLPLPRRTRI
jgi:hypothetical protein